MGLYPPFVFSYIVNDLAGLSENRKNSFITRKTNLSKSQKVVSSKHKKLPVPENKLQQKFRATRLISPVMQLDTKPTLSQAQTDVTKKKRFQFNA